MDDSWYLLFKVDESEHIGRYGTLIAFANYLLEKRSAMTGAMSSSFSLFTGNGDEQQQDFPSCACRPRGPGFYWSRLLTFACDLASIPLSSHAIPQPQARN